MVNTQDRGKLSKWGFKMKFGLDLNYNSEVGHLGYLRKFLTDASGGIRKTK